MIESFQGKYRFLSNFYPCPIRFDSEVYPSVEHAYQASKTDDEEGRKRIRNSPTPGGAKRLGRKLAVRQEFLSSRLEIMGALVWQKFSRNNELGDRLLATGDQNIVEGNSWGDTFWGVCNGVGENHLGRILMYVRQELLALRRRRDRDARSRC